MSSRQSDLEKANSFIWDEISRYADRVSELMFGGPSADASHLSNAAMAEHWQRNWDDPKFRQGELDRLAPITPDGVRPPEGVKKYLDTLKMAFPNGYTPPTPNDHSGLPGGPAGMGPDTPTPPGGPPHPDAPPLPGPPSGMPPPPGGPPSPSPSPSPSPTGPAGPPPPPPPGPAGPAPPPPGPPPPPMPPPQGSPMGPQPGP